MGRKTVNVSMIVDYCNTRLGAFEFTKSERESLISLCDNVLLSIDNYKGFRYLTNNELPRDELPGVRYNGTDILPPDERFQNTDHTRIRYS